ncbi:MAG: N-formylglutamate amidohydrolase [Gammaproteobacteria bacterium]|nr:N-formylglutamate amidohydrolase [Gammaproteobacteria bacterium]
MSSVTILNILSTIIFMVIGLGIAIAGAMANDSGKGGIFTNTFQFISLSYPVVYLLGVISSIAILYSDIDNKKEIAIGLSSINLIWLFILGLLFFVALIAEKYDDIRRQRQWEEEINNQIKPYLIHLPHCGTMLPEEYLDDYYLNQEKLNENIYQYADLYTDELFQDLMDRFGGVKNDYSRLFFDPERFYDDKQEKMSQLGLGWFYTKAILEEVPLRSLKNKEIIAKYYHAHHQALNEKTQEKLDLYGECTIIDCHSFSNERYWFHDQNMELPDICIGYDEDHVDIKLVEYIKEIFDGYHIEINKPYSGSLVPSNYYNKNKNVKSVMIEINKKLYLKSNNIDKNNDFDVMVFKFELLKDALIFHKNYDMR